MLKRNTLPIEGLAFLTLRPCIPPTINAVIDDDCMVIDDRKFAVVSFVH